MPGNDAAVRARRRIGGAVLVAVGLTARLWYTDATLTDNDLKARFTATYPEIRFNPRTVPYGYDIFNMLVQSFEKGGDPYQNLQAITEYNGKVGIITKSADSRNFRSQASIWTVKDGEFIQN